MADEREQKIRDRAYRIWQDEGQPEGREQAHWAQAEQEHGAGDDVATDLADSEPAHRDALISDAGADLPFGEPADTGAADEQATQTDSDQLQTAPPQTTAAEPTAGGAPETRVASASGAIEPPAAAAPTKKGARGKVRTKTSN